MRRRRLRRCLAVSTVIGNMMMILITLSLAAILVAWAGTTFGSFSGGSSLFFLQRGQALQERFVVEELFFVKGGGSSNYLRVFVRNVGVQQLNITAIYVNGTSYQPSIANTRAQGTASVVMPCKPSQVGTVVTVGETVGAVCEFQLAINNGFDPACGSEPWCTGDIFTIVVATSRGNQATYTARGP